MGFNGIGPLILQHLWLHYGCSLPRGSIQYAAMALMAAGEQLDEGWKVDACMFVSLFHSSLSNAIHDGTVSENDLFALLFVSIVVDILSDNSVREGCYLYLVGILDVASYLTKTHKNLDAFPLRCLWKPAISWARHSDSVLSVKTKELSLGLRFHVLAESIPDDVKSTDRRLTTLADWQRGILVEPPWDDLRTVFWDELHSLRAIFESHLGSPGSLSELGHMDWICQSLGLVESRYLTISRPIYTTLLKPQAVRPQSAWW
jgi:hypothetical protein